MVSDNIYVFPNTCDNIFVINPNKVVAPIAATVAAPYLLPELATLAGGAEGAAAFTGATETGLATLAGEGALADTVGATLLSSAAEQAATQALPYTLAADASNLAASGFDSATIAQNINRNRT